MSASYEQVPVDSRAQWRAWLTEHAASSPGIWLVTWKKGLRAVPALRRRRRRGAVLRLVGSQPRAVDDQRSSRLLTPRRPASNWSRVNKQRVQRLTDAGLMAPAGIAAVRAAQADGSWSALDQVETLTEPNDLRTALDKQPQARAHWDDFPRSTRRAILEWIGTTKTDTTRSHRIQQTTTEAAAGRRANQPRQPKGQG